MANILAVDDNLELCKLIRTTLERDGHRVETRQAGRDLTEALCRWADCILLDVMMPGEDGFAVCRRIRSLTEVPILFLSARTDEAAVLEGLRTIRCAGVRLCRRRCAATRARSSATRKGLDKKSSAPMPSPSSTAASSVSIWRCTQGRPLPRSKFTKRFLVLTALRTTPP